MAERDQDVDVLSRPDQEFWNPAGPACARAAIQGRVAADSEEILAQAGFEEDGVFAACKRARLQRIVGIGASAAAAEPAARRRLWTPCKELEMPIELPSLLPSRRLAEQAGVYKFADPDFCRCVYVGGAKEHAELQRLRAERLAEREWFLGRMSASMDRSMWGPWKPEGLDVVSRAAPGLPAPSVAAR